MGGAIGCCWSLTSVGGVISSDRSRSGLMRWAVGSSAVGSPDVIVGIWPSETRGGSVCPAGWADFARGMARRSDCSAPGDDVSGGCRLSFSETDSVGANYLPGSAERCFWAGTGQPEADPMGQPPSPESTGRGNVIRRCRHLDRRPVR